MIDPRTAVSLEWYELAMAIGVGERRQQQAGKLGCEDAHGFKGDGLEVHIEGACGEMAGSKWCGYYWPGTVGTFGYGGDAGIPSSDPGPQFRTRSRDYYDLIVRPNDRDEDWFILVVGRRPSYHIVGWLYGKEAKQERWVKKYGGRPPAYFIPQANLRSPFELQRRREE